MNISFEEKELNWIKELVEDRVAEMKENGDYEVFTYDKEIFESILLKIQNNN
ncbi:hypothetical protein N4T77_02855 [Clostridium sp. CX1]|uniref:hypothetical protein n=1 Tax=Clostridium sp. CX1 TaxID=2978346 RepID=UPI0021BFFAC1|nr:hypothetical protein [Clostridium sp. CX1]MCT8975531.1 hypothetical protein [Clostridium sp. CX1]